MVPDYILYNICMYVSYFDLDELFVTLHVSDLLRARFKKLIYNQRIKVMKYLNISITYTLENNLHREDGPAKTYDELEEYYINDKLHREDGPAVKRKDGNVAYYINGKLHREDGPAKISYNDIKEYYINGKLHRLDGPAIEYANGYKRWFAYGCVHRANGPAIVYPNGKKYYFLKGRQYTKKEYNRLTRFK